MIESVSDGKDGPEKYIYTNSAIIKTRIIIIAVILVLNFQLLPVFERANYG